jgi:hypothetical protein
MAYRMKQNVECLTVKDPAGIIFHHYQKGPYAGVHNRGPVIPWLNDEQREHFLRLGLVEEIADTAGTIAPGRVVVSPPAVQPAPETDDADALDEDDALDETVPDSGMVAECIATLDRLYVPATAGAPAARTALRGNDYKYGNAIIAAAVRSRKLSATAVS